MELQEFIAAQQILIKDADKFSNIGYEVYVSPHKDISGEYNLSIYITKDLFFSYNLKSKDLYMESDNGVVFIKKCDPIKAVDIIRGFVMYW
jgi:hypothetical protein